MNFDLDDDEAALVEVVQAIMHDRFGPTTRRAALGEGFDDKLWNVLAFETGLLPMALPESVGGDGGGVLLGGLVVRELGAALYNGPYLSALMAATALAETDDADARAVLTAMTDGSVRPTFVPASSIAAHADVDGWRLSGTADGVLDAATASHFVVATTTDDGARYFLVEADGAARAEPQEGFDLLRSVGRVDLADAPGAPLTGGGDATARRIDAGARALLASEQVGGARAALDSAVAYARLRHQFGRAIGSFQAIKHQCADQLVDNLTATAAVDHVLCALVESDPHPGHAAMALAMASDAYSRGALGALHVHGGIGFTWESDVHLHVRRAKSAGSLLGGPALNRELLLDAIGV